MKKIKKTIAVIACLTIVVGLVGCAALDSAINDFNDNRWRQDQYYWQ